MKPVPHSSTVDLKRIEAGSRSLERFLAALRRAGRERWGSPFASSGAKPPTTAPPRRAR